MQYWKVLTIPRFSKGGGVADRAASVTCNDILTTSFAVSSQSEMTGSVFNYTVLISSSRAALRFHLTLCYTVYFVLLMIFEYFVCQTETKTDYSRLSIVWSAPQQMIWNSRWKSWIFTSTLDWNSIKLMVSYEDCSAIPLKNFLKGGTSKENPSSLHLK